MDSYSKEYHSKATAEWRKRNKRKPEPGQHRRNLKAMYGLSYKKYEDMLVAQEFKCAICGKHQLDNKKRLSVDHCHVTGRIRGLLCSGCNRCLGLLQDNADVLKKAIIYLKESNG